MTLTMMEEVAVSVVAVVVVVHQTGRRPRGQLLLESVAVDDAGNDTVAVAVCVVAVAALRIGAVVMGSKRRKKQTLSLSVVVLPEYPPPRPPQQSY